MSNAKPTSVDDIRGAQQSLHWKAEAHLRASGWKHTSSTPGSYWMWEREIEGRIFLVEFESAMRIQAYYEAEERYRNDPPSSRRPDPDDDE